jgi:hypothetical protein
MDPGKATSRSLSARTGGAQSERHSCIQPTKSPEASEEQPHQGFGSVLAAILQPLGGHCLWIPSRKRFLINCTSAKS